ncbi:unnamed protein product [Paramecium primaurelia]|uniref:Uncharacterized protein n=1 Tax=Paramecium primaurelia TaxID=5886 RepID=A0A8S1NYU6_PARPR|nr:unnamed protein product [Paramecium primaurelia]
MKDNNLNSFQQYQTYSTYQSRTILPSNNQQQIKIQEYTRPEIQKINLKLDQMLESLNQFTPSLMNHQKQQESNLNNSQLETQLPNSQYNSFIGKDNIQYPQQQKQITNYRCQPLQYSITPQQTQYNASLKQEFDEYLQFKDFIKAKKLVLNNNAPLSDLYKYYLENDVYQKTKYYRLQEEKVNKIILQK